MNPPILRQVKKFRPVKEAQRSMAHMERRLKSKPFLRRTSYITNMGLKAFSDRIIVEVDVEGKNKHTFSDGTVIYLGRDFNNLDRKYTAQVLGIVIDGGGLPPESLLLFHHNAIHPVGEVFNYKKISGADIASGIRHFSIPENMAYLWKIPGEGDWMPLKGFDTALRVFEPVKTKFYGIAPKLIKNTLFMTSGEYQYQVVHTLRACDYEITFRNEKGVEQKIIRCRHFPGEQNNPREEIIAINQELTKKVTEGEYLVGLSVTDCYSANEINIYA